jgi:hypothetical protein
MKYIIFILLLFSTTTSIAKEGDIVIYKDINKVLSSPCKDTWVDITKILEGKCKNETDDKPSK